MIETTVDEERSFCGSASSGAKRRAEVKEALGLMSYANRLPRTSVLIDFGKIDVSSSLKADIHPP